MGQYHIIANFDKKEYLDSRHGSKLMEWDYQDQGILITLEKLMKNEWKGDRVLTVGDYADLGSLRDENVRGYFTLRELYREYNYLRDEKNIYDYIVANFKEIKWDVDNYSEENSRYIINTAIKEYVDIADCPIQFVWFNGKLIDQRLHPLPIMLSLSNGLGGGDYWGESKEYISYWTEFSNSIIFTNEKPTDEDMRKIDAEFVSSEECKTTVETLADAIVEMYQSRQQKGKEFDIDNLELIDRFVDLEKFKEAKDLAKTALMITHLNKETIC